MSAPDGQAIVDLIQATRVVQTIRAAVNLGVFATLEEGPTELSDLAWNAGVEPVRMLRLMDSIESLSLVERVEGGYAARFPRIFVERMLDVRDLAAALRGEPEWRGDTLSGAAALYPQVVPVLSELARIPARLAAEHLARPGLRILELGAGACGWSIAIARSCPDATVTANDVDPVLQRSRRAVEGAGLLDRYRFVAGDLFQLEPMEHDLVLVPLVLHLFDEARARELVQSAARHVAVGGQLVLIDIFEDEGPKEPGVALYSLELLSRTDAGQVHRTDRSLGWLSEAGLEVREHRLPCMPPICLLIGERARAMVASGA